MKETWSDTIKQMVKKAGKGKILLLIAVGVLLLLVSIKDSGRQAATTEKSQNTVTEQSTSDDMQRYREKMEKQVKEILEQVEGVGKADVMLTLQASKEKVTLKTISRTTPRRKKRRFFWMVNPANLRRMWCRRSNRRSKESSWCAAAVTVRRCSVK